jgi:hypothetical protein
MFPLISCLKVGPSIARWKFPHWRYFHIRTNPQLCLWYLASLESCTVYIYGIIHIWKASLHLFLNAVLRGKCKQLPSFLATTKLFGRSWNAVWLDVTSAAASNCVLVAANIGEIWTGQWLAIEDSVPRHLPFHVFTSTKYGFLSLTLHIDNAEIDVAPWFVKLSTNLRKLC